MAHDPMIVSLKKPQQTDPSLVVRMPSPRSDVRPPHHAPREPLANHEQFAQRDRSAHRDSVDQYAPQQPARAASARRRHRRRVPRFILLLAVAVIALVGFGIFASFAAHSIATTSDPSHMSQSEIDALVAHVGTLVLLPKGEEPTVATVTDLDALKGEAFFSNAVLGDKVLMYPKAQQAVLYDPQQDKVIEMAPLTVGGK